MRAKLVKSDLVEAVIGLGPNLFYNSPMESCVVVCRARKRKERRGRVLFVDAVNEVTRERAQSFVSPSQRARILAAYSAFTVEQGFSSVATLNDIVRREWNLSIPLYVQRTGSRKDSTNGSALPASWDAWEQHGREFWKEMERVMLMLDRIAGGVLSDE